ncbi:MAG: substrate-binding domain-containing protein [Solirubrobacteraceae bacterium]
MYAEASNRPRRARGRQLASVAVAASCALVVAACGSSSSASKSPAPAGSASGGSATTSSSGSTVKAALILKTFSNPYFVSMEKSAKADAKAKGVDLTVSAGTTDGDTATQITAIDNAIAAGDQGIVITPNGNAVNAALGKARAAGLYTIALDTAPTPASTVNITYATDNTAAGVLDGKWAAAKLAGKAADIALLDLFNNQVVSVDVDRDHGFLQGMGIPVGSAAINGKEPTSGHYTGGKGGTYKISCQLPTQGAIPTGKSAMQTCLQKDPNINLVYAINEPAAEGASEALKAAGSKALVVAIDGGCSNLPFVANGSINATAGQFPGKMAADGVDAIYNLVTKHVHPATSPGLGFFNTGTTLYTNDPQTGVPSATTTQAKGLCWG